MMYLRYLILVVPSLIADFLNLFLAPIVSLFAYESGWLPRWLWWFQTADNSLDGDDGWKTKNRPFMVEDTKMKRWLNRTRWIHRNSMYGFAIDVLGAKTLPSDVMMISGDTQVSNRPIFPGLVVRTLYREGKLIYFQWYYVKPWSKTRCIRINLGWKLWAFDPHKPGRCQLVFSPSLTMGYSK